jgi:hypothetical protein
MEAKCVIGIWLEGKMVESVFWSRLSADAAIKTIPSTGPEEL